MTEKVTAGRDQLGDFAAEFAKFNDDILFGEVWADATLDEKTRSMITVTNLMAQGAVAQLEFHIPNAKRHGVTAQEMAALITHNAFYSGWPTAWSAFGIAKEVYQDARK